MTTKSICPGCGRLYILGITGTVDGCDKCQRIIRNPIDHSIIDVEAAPAPICNCHKKAGDNKTCYYHGETSPVRHLIQA